MYDDVWWCMNLYIVWDGNLGLEILLGPKWFKNMVQYLSKKCMFLHQTYVVPADCPSERTIRMKAKGECIPRLFIRKPWLPYLSSTCLFIHSILFNLLLARLSQDNTLWSHLYNLVSVSLSLSLYTFVRLRVPIYNLSIFLTFSNYILIFNVMSSMIIKTCLVHCLFRSHPQRQPKRSPFLQGSGSTGEAFPVADWGMPQFLQEPGTTTDMGPLGSLGSLGWFPQQCQDGADFANGKPPFLTHPFSKWDHESRTCVLVTCVHPRIPSCWFTDSLCFTKELKQNCPNPWWCCAGVNAQKVPQAWQRFQPIRGAEVGPYLGRVRKETYCSVDGCNVRESNRIHHPQNYQKWIVKTIKMVYVLLAHYH